MIIKWIFEDIKPGQRRGPFAMSEDGNYQIVFDKKMQEFSLYIHTTNRIGRIAFLSSYRCPYHNINEMLIYMHRVIENYNSGNLETHAHLCEDCLHLIFKDYKERCGQCRLTRLYRRFTDICVNEDIAENDRITNE